jgi:DNA-binding XRE family transcriptional regulator
VARKTAGLKDAELLAEVGRRFKRAREDANVTHDDLTKWTGVNRWSIGRFERGERGMNTDALIAILSAAAENGVDVGFVFTGHRDARAAAVMKVLSDPTVLAGLEAAGLANAPKAPKRSGAKE